MVRKIAALIFLVFLVSFSFVTVVNAKGVKVGVLEGDRFTWLVETSGEYGVFANAFGREYDKIQTIRLEVTNVANPIVNYAVAISYDNGTQMVENASQNLETGIIDNALRGFFYPAGLSLGDSFQIDAYSFYIYKTETKPYLGVDRQVNYFNSLNTSNNGVGIYVDGKQAEMRLSFENSFDKLTGVLAESNEFWDSLGTPCNVTLTYKLLESTAFNSEDAAAAHLFSFPVSTEEETCSVNATSNSAVSDFSFSALTKEIKFNIAGASGTMGYAQVYIPKSLVDDASTVRVFLDNNEIEYTLEPGDNYNILFFRYQHSTHSITINLANGSQFGDWISYVVIAIIAGAIAFTGLFLILRKRKQSPQRNQQAKVD